MHRTIPLSRVHAAGQACRYRYFVKLTVRKCVRHEETSDFNLPHIRSSICHDQAPVHACVAVWGADGGGVTMHDSLVDSSVTCYMELAQYRDDL